MSAPTHDHGHTDHAVSAHGSLKGYLTGFGLSVALTAVPFWLVMTGALPPGVTGFIVVGFAAVQIVVHMIYFLHMNGKAEGGWTILAMIFTIIIVVITLSGSLWVMSHLNTNMGPAHDMSDAP
ncbi:cytochrome o ubiquinol oxidase subunit IV [soil metagenome]